jgi:hypothetical protein
MAVIPLDKIDDFMVANLPKWDKMSWQDISMPLQKYFYAQRLMPGNSKPKEMSGALVKWDVQYDYDDNFAVTGPHDPDVSSRKETLTSGQMFWSFVKANYTYDLREDLLNKDDVAILKWMDVKEHGLYNSFFSGMEKLMFGPGPATPNMTKPPPCSILWWLPAYTGAANGVIPAMASGVTSDFLGGDPSGFSSVGTGGISRQTYAGWRHRVGTYNVFSEDDAIDTIVECMDKCQFTPAKAYSELAPNAKPDWELLTTYSRLKLARRIAASNNDNLRGELAKWKDTVLIRGVPLSWVPAWTNHSFGCAQSNGPVVGVNWPTWDFYTLSAMNMAKSAPEKDKDNHLGRWRYLDHCCQIVLKDSRSNFIVTYGGLGSIVESN